MKKINYLFLLLVVSFLHTTSFAFVNNKNSCQKTLFYCPQKIECSEKGNVQSCRVYGSNLEYWNIDSLQPNAPITQGTYKFASAGSTYQQPNPDDNYAGCSYQNVTNRMANYIGISAKKSAYIEAAFDDSQSWRGQGYSVGCSGDDCPFIEPGLFIKKIIHTSTKGDFKAQVKLSVDGNIIQTGDTTTDIITYEKAFLVCGSVQQCKIDINIDTTDSKNPTYPIYIGSVIVNMMSDLHIVNVSPNSCSGYTMKRTETFNTISFEQSNRASCG